MASIIEDKSVKGQLNEIKRLLKSFDDPNTTRSAFERGQRKIKEIVKEFDKNEITLGGVLLTRYQIEITIAGGRGGAYVFNTSLIGEKKWNSDFSGGDDCMFECGDEECTIENMKQIYPDEQNFGDGNDYSPPRFNSYVKFISKLLAFYEEQMRIFKNRGKYNVTLSARISEAIGHKGITSSLAPFLPHTNTLTKEEYGTAYERARGTRKEGAKKRGAKKRGTRKEGAKKRGTRKEGAKKRGTRKEGAKKRGSMRR